MVIGWIAKMEWKDDFGKVYKDAYPAPMLLRIIWKADKVELCALESISSFLYYFFFLLHIHYSHNDSGRKTNTLNTISSTSLSSLSLARAHYVSSHCCFFQLDYFLSNNCFLYYCYAHFSSACEYVMFV